MDEIIVASTRHPKRVCITDASAAIPVCVTNDIKRIERLPLPAMATHPSAEPASPCDNGPNQIVIGLSLAVPVVLLFAYIVWRANERGL